MRAEHRAGMMTARPRGACSAGQGRRMQGMSEAAGVQAGRDLERVSRLFSGEHARWWRELYAGPARSPEEHFFRQRRDIACTQLAMRVAQDAAVLDLGCGAAPVLARLRRWGWRCTGLDGSADMLAQARHRLQTQGLADDDLHLGDARVLPFADASFGAVICLGVISYVENHEAVLAEIRRVLKPGGIALVSCRSALAPALWDPWQWVRRTARRVLRGAPGPEPFTPGRFMRPSEVRDDLQAAGLQVAEEIGIGYGPPRWAGHEWLPTRLALRLDSAVARLAARSRWRRVLHRAADIHLWVVRKPADQERAA